MAPKNLHPNVFSSARSSSSRILNSATPIAISSTCMISWLISSTKFPKILKHKQLKNWHCLSFLSFVQFDSFSHMRPLGVSHNVKFVRQHGFDSQKQSKWKRYYWYAVNQSSNPAAGQKTPMSKCFRLFSVIREPKYWPVLSDSQIISNENANGQAFEGKNARVICGKVIMIMSILSGSNPSSAACAIEYSKTACATVDQIILNMGFN